jgi:Tfp pilus assembly protein PilV
MAGRRRTQSGVSLVEALVALAVIGFGLVAYVGLQSTLGQNADIARQRAEAVRLTQEAIESARAFTALTVDPLVVQTTFAGIATNEEPETTTGINATYALRRTVIDLPDRNMKALMVETTWSDRNGDLQAVRAGTVIAAISPELAGTLAVPGSGNPQRLPGGRHPAIPIEAVEHDPGRSSRFVPPGSSVAWIFDNFSGVITSLCTTTDSCVATNALLLSGYVRFALGLTQPLPADAEVPPSQSLPTSVELLRTYPASATIACFTQQRSADVRYWCAVPVNADEDPGPPRWAGRSVVSLGEYVLADSRSDADATKFRVCRYTPYRDHRAVGEGNPPMRNADHPLDYGGDQPEQPAQGVDGPLTNQNFLVIRAAGEGMQPFDCPDDDTSTPFVDGRTWHHQPAD